MYTLMTYARHDNGEEDPTFSFLQIIGNFPDEQKAELCASVVATSDHVLYEIGKAFDGYAVVVFKNKPAFEPVVCFEHDGIDIRVWRGYEIGDQFRR